MPSSLVVTPGEFAHQVGQGQLFPAEFRWRFLAEGDSWMDRSAVVSPSLPHYLAREFDRRGESALIVNLAQFGDTMRRIGSVVEGEFASWVDFLHVDAILLSAGGNDFIDAARDPGPGQGLLRDLRHAPPPAQGRDCLRADALASLVTDYLDPNFARLVDAVRGSAKNAATPIFLNNYDTPTARPAPATAGGRTWLHEAYTANGIPEALWPGLTAAVFNELQAAIAGWQIGRDGLHGVPTDDTLTPAAPGSTGCNGDWLNEIHPNARGWRKLASVWADAVLLRRA